MAGPTFPRNRPDNIQVNYGVWSMTFSVALTVQQAYDACNDKGWNLADRDVNAWVNRRRVDADHLLVLGDLLELTLA